MSEHFDSIKKGLEEAVAYEKRRIEQNTHKKQVPEKDKTDSSVNVHQEKKSELLPDGIDQGFLDIVNNVINDYENALRNLKDR